MWLLLDFLYRWACYLQIKIVLFLSFSSGCLLFHFLALLPCLETPGQCWIGVVRVDILVLFLILEGSFQSFTIKYDISCGVFVDAFFRLRNFPSIPSLLRILKTRNGYWILWNAFSVSFEMIPWFFSFTLLWCRLINFQMLSQLYTPKMRPTWPFNILLN